MYKLFLDKWGGTSFLTGLHYFRRLSEILLGFGIRSTVTLSGVECTISGFTHQITVQLTPREVYDLAKRDITNHFAHSIFFTAMLSVDYDENCKSGARLTKRGIIVGDEAELLVDIYADMTDKRWNMPYIVHALCYSSLLDKYDIHPDDMLVQLGGGTVALFSQEQWVYLGGGTARSYMRTNQEIKELTQDEITLMRSLIR